MTREYFVSFPIVHLKWFILHFVIRIRASGGSCFANAVSRVRPRAVESSLETAGLLLFSVLFSNESDFHDLLARLDLLHRGMLHKLGVFKMIGNHGVEILIRGKFAQGLFRKWVH